MRVHKQAFVFCCIARCYACGHSTHDVDALLYKLEATSVESLGVAMALMAGRAFNPPVNRQITCQTQAPLL